MNFPRKNSVVKNTTKDKNMDLMILITKPFWTSSRITHLSLEMSMTGGMNGIQCSVQERKQLPRLFHFFQSFLQITQMCRKTSTERSCRKLRTLVLSISLT
ncbi:hypothetical protein J6590_083708 [Homalodisca vitripennis]|nr:hypothetical protein J6590_083708 [Homalodisca vitripennis]